MSNYGDFLLNKRKRLSEMILKQTKKDLADMKEEPLTDIQEKLFKASCMRILDGNVRVGG